MFGWEQGRIFRYHCGSCGDWFLRYKGRFFILNEDLSIRAYQQMAGSKTWETDRNPQVPSALLNTSRDAWISWKK